MDKLEIAAQSEKELFTDGVKSLQQYRDFMTNYITDPAEKKAMHKVLDSLKKDYTLAHDEFKNLITACSNTRKEFEKNKKEDVDLEEMYKKELERIEKRGIRETQTIDLPNTSVVVSQTFQIPLDPLTRKSLKNPVRNKICKHLYERESIMIHLKHKKNNIACPFFGCTNKNVKANQLEDDDELRAKIIEYGNDEANGSSFIDIDDN